MDLDLKNRAMSPKPSRIWFEHAVATSVNGTILLDGGGVKRTGRKRTAWFTK